MSAELSELEALLEKATPGPWEYVCDSTLMGIRSPNGIITWLDEYHPDNARLMVWLVNNAPKALRAAEERIAELEESFARFINFAAMCEMSNEYVQNFDALYREQFAKARQALRSERT